MRMAGAALMLGAPPIDQHIREFLSASDADQGVYWTRFVEQILSGRLTRRAIKARVALYGSATWQIAMNAVRSTAIRSGEFTEEARVLGRGEDHCQPCIDWSLDRVGWQPLGSLPPLGESDCLMNCRCHWRFR
jgi:hypothetical protein